MDFNKRRTKKNVPVWPILTGIVLIMLAFVFFIFRSGIIVFFIFSTIGVSLILFWYYLYTKKNKSYSDFTHECICPICNHDKAVLCVEKKCACCIIMKKDKIIGHSNTSLQ